MSGRMVFKRADGFPDHLRLRRNIVTLFVTIVVDCAKSISQNIGS